MFSTPKNLFFSVTSMVTSYIGASLVSMDVNGKIIPYLAESWDISEDGLTWTFHLREDAKFHNGDPVTANDWVYTFERFKDPATVSPNISMVKPITSYKAIDDYTLELKLDTPYYPMLNTLAGSSYLGVLSKRAIEEAGDQYGTTQSGAVGAGPYVFKEWVQDEKIILQRNPDFNWGPVLFEGCNSGPAYIDTIEFRIIPDYATQLAGLESGDLNYAGIQGKDVATVEATNNYTLLSSLDPAVRYFEFNLSKAPFDNEDFRQAINYSIDRDSIVKVVYPIGDGQKNLTPISPSMIGYDPAVEQAGLDYNPDKAKALFTELGYTLNADGMLEKDGQPLVLNMISTPDDTTVKIAQLLIEQLKAVGIELKLQTLEWGAMSQQLVSGDFEVDLMMYGYSDTDILYLIYHSSSGFWNKINDPEVDSLLDATRTEMDPVKHQAAVNAATTYLMEHAYAAPISTGISYNAISNNIGGVKYSNFIGGVSLLDAYFTDLP